jgi:ABC-2 type transport system ATP-binding protein
MITATNLTKRFGDITAVNDVSFQIRKGEIFGLLGPNGAGKTTTINMMVGILKPDSGTIELEGIGNPQNPKSRQQMGNSPQALAIYEELTAEENLAFFGRLYGLAGKKLDQQVNWALELAGLTERRRNRISTYSGGMKRRLNLVCALVHDPQILFFDEPTVGVDPQSRNLIFDQIEQLRGSGRTIIYTTHYMGEAQRLCDRVAIIDHGKILDIDSVNRLIDKHGGDAVVTADLMGKPPSDVELPGELDGASLRFDSKQPFDQVAELNSRGIKFQNLHIERPDLESVFLNLTGRSLRD